MKQRPGGQTFVSRVSHYEWFEKAGALSLLVFNFALDYSIKTVQASKEGLKLNGTHQPPVYADDVNILDRSVHTVQKNRSLVLASKEIGLAVNADKNKYMVMSRDQNAGRNHNLKIDNRSFEGGGTVEIFGKNLKIKTYIQE